MFTKVLVPIDSSEESRTIIRWAAGLARATKAEITLLSVVDPEDIQVVEAAVTAAGQASDSTDSPFYTIDKIVKDIRDDLEVEAEALSAFGIKVDVQAVHGTPAEMIVSEAEAIGADLIAMSTRRDSALARGVLGSVTDRVLHSTTIPLLILQPEDINDVNVGIGFIRKIVVPLDGSELSETAVAPATELARATDAELVFTEVVRLPVYGMDLGGVGYGSVHYAESIDTRIQEEDATAYLKAFVENAESAGLKARAQVRVGNPSIQIVEEAAAAEGSIIVMATHGAGGIKRWIIGSVTDKAIRTAHRPVLVIPHKAE